MRRRARLISSEPSTTRLFSGAPLSGARFVLSEAEAAVESDSAPLSFTDGVCAESGRVTAPDLLPRLTGRWLKDVERLEAYPPRRTSAAHPR
ncbi:hypothetical protein MOPEL_130_01840 [Mobilicoccus pelagius NBRC 104925]|uniref:Uncharacterized protein n=1 Tax=Mobilicoccus pelagius NBRC 104925 TaxID=1089455 RepID=H5UV19_9MICO|nr:hypothetical protein MOPEL_130_01840 [Mobilicoccus pelagius NBRC 104925]